MSTRLVIAVAAGLSLSGCCIGSGCYIPLPATTPLAWDGLGSPPTRHPLKRAKVRKAIEEVAAQDDSPREEDLAGLKPYSKEWGAVRDAIDRAADAKLKTKLVICRNCMALESDDQTGSIGYLSKR